MSKDFFKWFKLNIGSCLSWAITFAWLIFIYFKIHNGILPTNLNEFGDFIAGAFAPLAFFWLVRGFYQQGKGLEQNSEALIMQAMELSNSTKALNAQVIEQKKLLELTKDQIEINAKNNDFNQFYQKKQLQPFFHIKKLKVDQHTLLNSNFFSCLEITFSLTNSRATCRNIFFTYTFWDELAPANLFNNEGVDILNSDSNEQKIVLKLKKEPEFDEQMDCRLILQINYTDAVDRLQYQQLSLYLRKHNNHIRLNRYVWSTQTLN